MTQPSFYDVRRLLQLRDIVDQLDPDSPPHVRFLSASPDMRPRRLALLAGSFNPPTNAHLALADAVMATGQVDQVVFLLATRTVNKERLEGASLPDRLLLLEALAAAGTRRGVALVNRGLFVDQAELIRTALPTLDDLWFAVGFDKIVQILDPRYYHDRDAALGRLFALARLFVAPRGDAEFDDLETLLTHPENRRFADRIVALDLPTAFRDVSSSRLRSHNPGSIADVPDVVRGFIQETGAYAGAEAEAGAGDRYMARERALAMLPANPMQLPTDGEFREAVDRLREADLDAQPGLGTRRETSGDVPRPPQADPL